MKRQGFRQIITVRPQKLHNHGQYQREYSARIKGDQKAAIENIKEIEYQIHIEDGLPPIIVRDINDHASIIEELSKLHPGCSKIEIAKIEYLGNPKVVHVEMLKVVRHIRVSGDIIGPKYFKIISH